MIGPPPAACCCWREGSWGGGRASVHQHIHGEKMPTACLYCHCCCLQRLFLHSTGNQFPLTHFRRQRLPSAGTSAALAQLLSLSCSVRGPCVQGEGFEQKPKEPEELRIPERSQKAFLETPSGGWRFGETQCCLSLQDQQLQGEGSQAGELAVCKRCASVQIMRVWWGKGE